MRVGKVFFFSVKKREQGLLGRRIDDMGRGLEGLKCIGKSRSGGFRGDTASRRGKRHVSDKKRVEWKDWCDTGRVQGDI